jgi:hypothetical protein
LTASQTSNTPARAVGQLAIATLVLWALSASAAYYGRGDEVVAPSLPAVLLCLVPAALTLWWTMRAVGGAPDALLIAFVGGAFLRLVVVIGGSAALYLLVPWCHQLVFWAWVLAFYLFTLGAETFLVMKTIRGSSPS